MTQDAAQKSQYGPIRRLARSLSKTKSSDPSTTHRNSDLKPIVERSTDHISSPVPPKLTAVNRIKLFILSKTKKQPNIPFPPPSWFEHGNVVHPGAFGAAPVPVPSNPKEGNEGDGNEDDGGSSGDTPPTATWIAGKIQAMIDSLPPLSTSGSGSSSLDPPPSNNTQVEDPKQPVVSMDSKLLKFLSNASIMNGSISKGRQSVWSALEKLQSTWHLTNETMEEQNGVDDESECDGNIDLTLMMYAPLVPDANSEVEIAHSHTDIVSASGLEGVEAKIEEATSQLLKWPWPFSGWKGKSKQDPPANNGGKAPVPPKANPPEGGKKLKEIRVWEPSATKVSVQLMWWGYRLYVFWFPSVSH
jgi:hypothetical protein